MTLAQLSITVALLAALGLVASRVGLSAIPAYLLAGLLLGPNEPKVLSLIQPLAVLVAEDLVIGLVLGFAAGGGGAGGETLGLVAKAIAFVAVALAVSKWLSGVIDRVLDWLPREFFLLAVFALLFGSAALAKEL